MLEIIFFLFLLATHITFIRLTLDWHITYERSVLLIDCGRAIMTSASNYK